MTRKLIKEIGLGAGIAVLGFLLWKGYDVLPLVFIIGFFIAVYFFAESKGLVKPVGFQETNVKKYSDVTFDDIGGQDSAIKELKEALDFIKNYEQIARLGIRLVQNARKGGIRILLLQHAGEYGRNSRSWSCKGGIEWLNTIGLYFPFSVS